MKTVTTKTITVQVVETNTTRWLDRCKEKLGGISDYALAPRLGISKGAMSNYRQGKSFLSDDVALKVAEILEIDPRPVIASAHAERAESEPARQFWARWAAAAAAGLVVTVGGTPPPSAAATVAAGPQVIVMSNDGKGSVKPFNLHPVTAGYHLPG